MCPQHCSHITCGYSTDIPFCEFCDSALSSGNDSQALLGVLWLVSIQWSMGKAFAGTKKLTAQHKMHLYGIETFCVVMVGSRGHVGSSWVSLCVCIIGSFLFAWRMGKARVSSQASCLCHTGVGKRKPLEELGQSWCWGARGLGQRLLCEPLPASLLPTQGWQVLLPDLAWVLPPACPFLWHGPRQLL